MIHNRTAVSRSRGVSFSASGPGASCWRSALPPGPAWFNTAIAKTMIPIPPSHWVSDRQKRIDCECEAMSAITLEPVVVKPLIASK